MSETFSEMVTRLFVKPETPMLKMVHGALGLLTEIGEIKTEEDVENLKLEIGDAMFYIEAIYQSAGECKLVSNNAKPQAECGDPFSDVGSMVKAAWIYGRLINRDQLFDLLDKCDLKLAEQWGQNLNECRKAVMQKLQARYPNGYSDQAANERADTK